MRGSVKAAGAAALVALTLCGTMPVAQAGGGIGVGGAVALGAMAPPVYVEEVCHVERRGYIDPYGVEHIRRVRVCE
jgi:hypothetical protein